jgi:cold shock CspA family protein
MDTYKLFDDAQLDAHIKHLTKPPRRKSKKEVASMNTRKSGTVTKVKSGYLFVRADDTGESIFVHVSNVKRSGINWDDLTEGTRLEFDVVASRTKVGKFEGENLAIEKAAP